MVTGWEWLIGPAVNGVIEIFKTGRNWYNRRKQKKEAALQNALVRAETNLQSEWNRMYAVIGRLADSKAPQLRE